MPITRTLAALALAATTAIAACAPVSSPDALPGTIRLSAGEAAGYFQQICIANANNLSATQSALAAGPYTYNTVDARYYHRDLDLSFALSEVSGGRVQCEIGWRGTSSERANQSAISNVSRNSGVRYNGDIDVYFATFVSAV